MYNSMIIHMSTSIIEEGEKNSTENLFPQKRFGLPQMESTLQYHTHFHFTKLFSESLRRKQPVNKGSPAICNLKWCFCFFLWHLYTNPSLVIVVLNQVSNVKTVTEPNFYCVKKKKKKRLGFMYCADLKTGFKLEVCHLCLLIRKFVVHEPDSWGQIRT